MQAVPATKLSEVHHEALKSAVIGIDEGQFVSKVDGTHFILNLKCAVYLKKVQLFKIVPLNLRSKYFHSIKLGLKKTFLN